MNFLTDEQVKIFNQESVLILPNFLSKDLCKQMISYLENAEEDIITRRKIGKDIYQQK